MTPYTFSCNVLGRLYNDARNGRGTDLEVLVPVARVKNEASSLSSNNNDEVDESTKKFHLHHIIVAASSRYFATFPEPKIGRVIDDIDADTFSYCVEFMYRGDTMECHGSIRNDNVASILYAAEMLQIDELKKKCFEHLEDYLQWCNHEQVVKLAEQYNNPDLKKSAQRFLSENPTRDDLVQKRASLIRQCDVAKHDERQAIDKKERLSRQVEQVDLQLKIVFKKQHEDALRSNLDNIQPTKGGNIDDIQSIPFAFGSEKKPGAIGHLVYPKNNYKERSTTAYGDDNEYDSDSVDEYGDYLDEYGDIDYDHPPPPPTRYQYETYGIAKSHDFISTAIEQAKDGDRIYLVEGVHEDDHGDYIMVDMTVDKDLEFIGLGERSAIVVNLNATSDQRFLVTAGLTGFYNITFQATEGQGERLNSEDQPNTSKGSGDDAMISINQGGKFVMKNCEFHMGTDCDTALPTRVSGLFLKRAESAVIEGCNFLGGAGSAIAVLNDPLLHTPSIEINQCSFVSCGQPSFSEKCAKQVFENGELRYEALPVEEVTPGPSAVELWRFNRKLRRIKRHRNEKHNTVSVKMTNCKFESNLRAPLAYRAISPSLNSSTLPSKANTWHLHNGKDMCTFAQGFNLVLSDNSSKGNGLQFEEEAIYSMLHTSDDRKAKKVCTGDNTQSKTNAFPDGESILVIEHNIGKFDVNSFPERWGEGKPFENFDVHDAYYTDPDEYSGSDSENSHFRGNSDFDELIDPMGIWH